MSQDILSLSDEQLTAFDLDALIAQAEVFNQHNREAFTTPFPKAPSRWLSHYEFTSHPIDLTSQGNVDGGSCTPTLRIMRSAQKPANRL